MTAWGGGLRLNLPKCYGSDFADRIVSDWRNRIGVKTLYIWPGSPWESGSNRESNNTEPDPSHWICCAQVQRTIRSFLTSSTPEMPRAISPALALICAESTKPLN